MDNRKRRWAGYKALGNGYYHLCTDGWKDGRLFNTDSQFAFGMTSVAIASVRCGVRVKAFELMRNHGHFILVGTGEQCCKFFFYIKRRMSWKLVRDGDPPLPEYYDFKLIPIENVQQMRNNLIYVARNPYEKGFAAPGCYPWGSGYLYYSPLAQFITGPKVRDLSCREIRRQLHCEKNLLPENWIVHPALGVLPVSFVDTRKVYSLFPSPKEWNTAVVKDYESFAMVASAVGEELEFSIAEARIIVHGLTQRLFQGKALRELSKEEKYRMASVLSGTYSLSPGIIAQAVELPEAIVIQVLRSKEYGLRPRYNNDA